MSDTIKDFRGGDPSTADIIYTRGKRFFKEGSQWFFKTREGQHIGPFEDKCEAQLALAYFVDRTQWPDSRQLREYMRAYS